MLKYKAFAAAFAYPADSFYEFFPELSPEKEKLMFEYDRLFRADEVWLYGTEHLAQNEFQRANYLSDIMGFYRAFGLEPDKDRPDSLSCELEFMHYLIFKGLHALKDGEESEKKENARICLDAQRKFFTEHLCPAAKEIGKTVIAQAQNDFYVEIANEMLEFLESEEKFLGEIQ